MAPIAQTPPGGNDVGSYDGSRPRFESLQAWLEIYGEAEYAVYKKDHAATDLKYDEWATSVHAHGMYLWHAALDVWEEPSSSDDGSELETTKLVLRGPSERKPKKPLTNGHGMRRAAKTAKSTSREKADDPTASGKRRRKLKKKYLSQEIIATDDSDDIEESTIVDVAAQDTPKPSPPASPSVPIGSSNGRRKSGGRRKKHFLSEETILPEDEETDSLSINAVAAADATNALDALALEQRTPKSEPRSKPPRAKPGPKPGKRARKKYLSQETIAIGDDDDSIAADSARSNTATASPEDPGSASRRGLRARTATQQRPYSQDARMFEEQLSAEPESIHGVKRSPKPKTTKLAQVSYPGSDAEAMEQEPDDEDGMMVDEDDFDQGDDALSLKPYHYEPKRGGRKAHYKGKGRAWKKTSEDEDEDYKSPVKIKSAQPKRKSGRRKSAHVAESVIREVEMDDTMEAAATPPEQNELAARIPTLKVERAKRKPRKSHHLSEEFVRDDTDTEVGEEHKLGSATVGTVRERRRPKSRSRNSDQSTSTKSTMDIDGEEDNDDEEEEQEGSESGAVGTKRTPKAHSAPPFHSDSSGKARSDCEEHNANLLSPLKEPRKRKSVGSDDELE